MAPRVVYGLVVLVSSVYSQTVPTNWAAQWSTATCSGSVAQASCGEMNNDFSYVGQPDGSGYIWADPGLNASTVNATGHFFCQANGTAFENASRPCGEAVFRIFCSKPAFVMIFGEGQSSAAAGPAGNDDSFWSFFDGNRAATFMVSTGISVLAPNWGTGAFLAGPTYLSVGPHTFSVAEREDGSRFRRLGLTSGYSDCQFGLPSASVSTQVSTAVSALRTDLVTQIQLQTSSIAATNMLASATSTALSSMRARLTGLAGFGVGSGVTASSPQVVGSGQDITLTAGQGGTVRVVGSQCSSDLCGLTAQVSRLTDALRTN